MVLRIGVVYVMAEQITVRFRGKLRKKLEEKAMEFDGDAWDDIGRTLDRQKTNVVIRSEKEADSLISKLEGHTRGRVSMHASMNQCASRVIEDIKDGLEAANFEDADEDNADDEDTDDHTGSELSAGDKVRVVYVGDFRGKQHDFDAVVVDELPYQHRRSNPDKLELKSHSDADNSTEYFRVDEKDRLKGLHHATKRHDVRMGDLFSLTLIDESDDEDSPDDEGDDDVDDDTPTVCTDGGRVRQTTITDPTDDVAGHVEQQADEAFPFPSYREYQKEAYHRASQALYGDDEKDVVILNLPTGIGKSGICTGLARQAEGGAFLTTPMKSLRKQLEDDDVLRSHYSVLRARADYACDAFGTDHHGDTYTCATCPCGRGATEESCKDVPDCTYWNAKATAMHDDIATLTFAYLILDGMIPEYTNGFGMGMDNALAGDDMGEKISFGHRELLVTDEVHKLEDYVASLFAGMTISPFTLPKEVYGSVGRNVSTDDDRIEDIAEQLSMLASRAEDYVARYEDSTDDTHMAGVDDCESFLQKYRHLSDELEHGRDWVVNVDTMTVKKKQKKKIELKPVDVDYFLKKKIWCRSDKIVLSTATMPHEDNPRKWLKRLGLGDKSYEYINYPMPFPEENRPIETDTQIAKFSSGGDKQHWGEIEATVDELIRRHAGERGLIHTASYERAEKLHRAFPDRTFLHDSESPLDAKEQIARWQQSDKPVFLSPSCMDGVDLEGDMCRWQVLLKVPYPYAGDSRVSFMLNERKDWDWYYEQTALNLIQSVGRGVRSKDDECVYYVLDRCWDDVMDRASVPGWFKSAIN